MLNFFRVSKLDTRRKIFKDPKIYSHFLLRNGVFQPVLLGAVVASTARGGGAGLGSTSVSTAALAGGGNNPGGDINSTEEFTGETTAANVKTITTS